MDMHDQNETPRSGVAGIQWSKAHGKWIVKIRVGGRDIYGGLYVELEDARNALAALRLEHGDPVGRGHDDTTVSLTDDEIVKHWALDDEGDPVWRDRPLAGDDKEVREAARWNSRHGGKKLDERAKLVGHRHMWRSDIIERLVKIRDASPKGRAVPPPRKQTSGIRELTPTRRSWPRLRRSRTR
jgi:hypothetical protein